MGNLSVGDDGSLSEGLADSGITARVARVHGVDAPRNVDKNRWYAGVTVEFTSNEPLNQDDHVYFKNDRRNVEIRRVGTSYSSVDSNKFTTSTTVFRFPDTSDYRSLKDLHFQLVRGNERIAFKSALPTWSASDAEEKEFVTAEETDKEIELERNNDFGANGPVGSLYEDGGASVLLAFKNLAVNTAICSEEHSGLQETKCAEIEAELTPVGSVVSFSQTLKRNGGYFFLHFSADNPSDKIKSQIKVNLTGLYTENLLLELDYESGKIYSLEVCGDELDNDLDGWINEDC